jgi:hypothetical protein
LESFLKGVQGGLTTAELLKQPFFIGPPLPAETLFVADFACALSPFNLGLSVRAERALRQLRVEHLGDLNGITMEVLLSPSGCWKQTAHEIQRFIQRANNEEFDIAPKKPLGPLTTGELLEQIDDWLLRLSKRDSHFLLMRYGGVGAQPPTLALLGRKAGITRERVRQILRQRLIRFLKKGDPRIKAAISQLAGGSPPPPEPAVLPKRLRHNPEFYVSIINAFLEHC